MKKIWTNTALLLSTLILLPGCAIHQNYGPYKGKVVDAETEEPIEGAVLFMEFRTLSGTAGGSTSHFADAKEVLTNKNGEFFLQHSVTIFRPGQLWDPLPKIYLFKPGYGLFPWKGTTITPEPNWSGIYENKYSIIKLPKLMNETERLEVLGHIFILDVPYEKQRNIFELMNQEYIDLGKKPKRKPLQTTIENWRH